jgi:hypothetical protein
MPNLEALARKDRKVAVLHRQIDDMERNIDAGQLLHDEGNGLHVPMSSFYGPPKKEVRQLSVFSFLFFCVSRLTFSSFLFFQLYLKRAEESIG